MLTQVEIKNLGIVSELDILFSPGLTVITGESGAGKSIVVNAIGLLLGQASDAHLIKDGQDFLSVTGYFNFETPFHEGDDGDSIVFRKITKSKTSLVKVNGEPLPLRWLKENLGTRLLLASQHDSVSLLSSSFHLELFDQLAGEAIQKELNTFSQELTALRSVEARLQDLQKKSDLAQRDYLQFQIQDIDSQGFKLGEEATLTDLKETAKSISSRRDFSSAAQSGLSAIDSGIHLLRSAATKFKQLSDSGLLALEAIQSHAEILSSELSSVDQQLETMASLDRDTLESRLDLIFRYKSKYKVDSLNALISYAEGLRKTVENSETHHDLLDALQKEVSEKRSKLNALASHLHSLRVALSSEIVAKLISELKDVGFQSPTLSFNLSQNPDRLSSSGSSECVITISFNAGESEKPLHRIASGGEISRLLLAFYVLLSKNRSRVETLVFDEVDSGIGGITANKVGEKIKALSAHHQVICVTHLPQIAKYADSHLKVEKLSGSTETSSTIQQLNAQEISLELKRMMGGDETIRHFHSKEEKKE